MKRLILLVLLVAAVPLVLATGCSREKRVSAAATVTVENAPDPTLVTVNHPEEFPLYAVETRRTPNELQVNCVVTPDVSRSVPVSSLSGGRVVEILARLGDDVTQGQLLLRINSPDLSQAISDYKKFQADEALARKALERSQALYSHGAIAEKDLETAQDTEQKAKVDVATAADRIRLLGGKLDNLSSIFDVFAPVSGTIVEQNVTAAAGVKSLDNSPNLFTIADLSHVWVLCDVYENNLAEVHLDDFADVLLSAYPNHPLKGRVGNISRVLDPNTRTAKVRLELSNSSGILRPGMFATATFTSQGDETRMVVPTSAILRLHDKDWVFRADGSPGHYKRTEIHAGPVEKDGSQLVLGGLQPGDQVVKNALQFSSTADQM
jgi:cobalt-zinc-cadmium efflux system membrane fusion protein